MSERTAPVTHPVHELVGKRWSPYVYSSRAVPSEDLKAIFEAARWAPSSYNEQPWRYIVALRSNEEEFQRLLSCLVEPNQAWAQHAPVLALGIASLQFARNQKANGCAHHDLGAASANLTFEASSRDLYVHQMAGILPEKARELYEVPESFQVLTALAIGYLGDPSQADSTLADRDSADRNRKPLEEVVFSGEWGMAANLGE